VTHSNVTAMFAKRAKQSSQQQPPSDDGSQTAQSGPDPRDAAIERLERELGEQSALATTLREQLDAATFKVEVLEKSYAKQLADTRDKRATIEAELQEKNEVLANLGGGHEHTLRELNDALTVIKVLKAERDKLRKQIAQGGFRQRDEAATRAPLAALTEDASDGGGTINALIANAGWAEKKKPEVGSGHANAQVGVQDTPHEEMLAPELVFTGKDRESDDER
jgi:chromosome segregation ATPase